MPDLIVKGGTTYRVVSDHLGTPRLVLDQGSGSVVERLDADEWGNVVADTNVGWQPFGFDGGLQDAATGLVRFGARDLLPAGGVWASREPKRFSSSVVNLYGFADGDPVNGVDIDGRTVLPDSGNSGDFDLALNNALEQIGQTPLGKQILDYLAKDDNLVVIKEEPGEIGQFFGTRGSGIVSLELSADVGIDTFSAGCQHFTFRRRLAHELAHAYRGTPHSGDSHLPFEVQAVQDENQIVTELVPDEAERDGYKPPCAPYDKQGARVLGP